MSDVKITETRRGIEVCLNRPDKHNAFTPKIIQELTKIFLLAQFTAKKRKNIRYIKLFGSGASFCAGADIDWMKSSVRSGKKVNQAESNQLFDMFQAAVDCPVPILGYVHGSVFGGGVGLTSICDVAAAEFASKFCFSEVKLGLVPAVISSFVARKMRNNKMKELMLTARVFSADEAKEAGLIEFVGRELDSHAYLDKAISHILNNGPEAVSDTKSLCDFLWNADRKSIKKQSVSTIVRRRSSVEGQEGMESFLAKRKASWVVEN